MLIFSSVFFRPYYSDFVWLTVPKIILIYLTLELGAALPFTRCLKASFFCLPLSLSKLSSNWLPLVNRRFEQLVGWASALKTVLIQEQIRKKTLELSSNLHVTKKKLVVAREIDYFHLFIHIVVGDQMQVVVATRPKWWPWAWGCNTYRWQQLSITRWLFLFLALEATCFQIFRILTQLTHHCHPDWFSLNQSAPMSWTRGHNLCGYWLFVFLLYSETCWSSKHANHSAVKPLTFNNYLSTSRGLSEFQFQICEVHVNFRHQ